MAPSSSAERAATLTHFSSDIRFLSQRIDQAVRHQLTVKHADLLAELHIAVAECDQIAVLPDVEHPGERVRRGFVRRIIGVHLDDITSLPHHPAAAYVAAR